jgi:peptidoglycan/LPS O-acetylase OafA/YrhL
MRRLLLLLLTLSFVTAVGFIVAIVGNPGSGVTLHEVAAAILLVLLVGAFGVAWRLRTTSRGSLYRVTISLIALLVAAAIGSSLATTALIGVWPGLPLLPLAVMLGSVGDGIRLTAGLPTTRPANDPEPSRR